MNLGPNAKAHPLARVYRIAAGGESDLPKLATAHRLCFPEAPWSQETLQGLLQLQGYHLRVAGPEKAADGHLFGFCLFRTAADEAEIITLGVVPQARRCGLARALLQDFLDQVRKAEARHLFLEVAEDNSSAIKLYQQAGFIVNGRRPGYYDHDRTQPVDALVMECHLN